MTTHPILVHTKVASTQQLGSWPASFPGRRLELVSPLDLSEEVMGQ